MANEISGVETNDGLDRLAQYRKDHLLAGGFFACGEAGYTTSGGQKIPKTPDGTKTRMESQGTILTGLFSWDDGVDPLVVTCSVPVSGLVAGEWFRRDSVFDGSWHLVADVTGSTVTVDPSTPMVGSASGVVMAKVPIPYFIFQKAFGSGDVLWLGAGTFTCQLNTLIDFLEGNGPNQLGNPPEFFEVGIFDDDGKMVDYGTFPGEVKTSSKILNNVLQVVM